MTIPSEYLYPLGALTVLGAIHAAFALEEMARDTWRAVSKRLRSPRGRD